MTLEHPKSPSPIPVALCFDEGYAPYAAVATYTAYVATKSPVQFYWVVFDDARPVAEKIAEKVTGLGASIEIVTVNSKDFEKFKEKMHFTRATYLRLFLPELLNEEKILYLDADLVVQRDLSELHEVQLGDTMFGGVEDLFGSKSTKISLPENDTYLNAGVLLVNMKKLREEQFTDTAIDEYTKSPDSFVWLDQCLINKISTGQKYKIEKKWNTQIFSNQITKDFFYSVCHPHVGGILHFVGQIKPWQKWCNPAVYNWYLNYYKLIFLDEKHITPVKNINQLIAYCAILEKNGDYKESAMHKSHIINILKKTSGQLKN